jgi:transposase
MHESDDYEPAHTHVTWSAPHPPDYEPTKIGIWRNGNMSRKRRSFTPEYKEEAAKLVIETSRPIAESARDIGINEQTLRNWVNAYRKAHAGEEPPLSVSERAELRELKEEVRELRLKSEFLGKAAAFFAQEYR